MSGFLTYGHWPPFLPLTYLSQYLTSARYFYGTSVRMWSPGGYDFSTSITDFVILILPHAKFPIKLRYSEIAFVLSCGFSRLFRQSVLKCGHALHITFTMCHCRILIFAVYHQGDNTFCMSPDGDNTLLKCHSMTIRLLVS